MGDASVADMLEVNTEYPFELKTKVLGNVNQKIVDEVANTIKDVFVDMGYMDMPPLEISISDGGIQLQSGNILPACYEMLEPDRTIPGRILLSSRETKKCFGDSEIPGYVATAAFAAHEAVEHVNHMRGKKLLMSGAAIAPEDHKADTEIEANETAREVIEKRYGWTVHFGDENI
jgi:hypothetical protein